MGKNPYALSTETVWGVSESHYSTYGIKTGKGAASRTSASLKTTSAS